MASIRLLAACSAAWPGIYGVRSPGKTFSRTANRTNSDSLSTNSPDTKLPSTIEYSSGLIDNPREGGHGSKLLWRFVQMAQACLDGIHHLVQGVEDLIAYIVFANVLPDVFGG